MIALPNVVISDTPPLGADTSATGAVNDAVSGEDFLNLLTGALTQAPTRSSPAISGEKTASLPVTNSLEAITLPLGATQPIGIAPETDSDIPTLHDVKTQAQSLTQWLVQQEATKTLVTPDSDTVGQSDAQSLLSSLAAHLKSELTSSKAQTTASEHEREHSETSQSDDELSQLSALMAMLPVPVQTRQTGDQATSSAGTDNPAALTAAAPRREGKAESIIDTKATQSAPTPADTRALPADATFAVAAQKVAAESAPSPSASTQPLAPVVGQSTTTVATAPVVANVPAALGTPDWQHSVSQHITLFTRQGQQTAELRLHPESLGQINITLKVDDNQAQIQMASPHSHVRAALEAALPVLRSQLENNGIQLGQSSISSGGFAGQQQPSQQQSFSARSNSRTADNQDDDERIDVPLALQSAARGDNAVDIFA